MNCSRQFRNRRRVWCFQTARIPNRQGTSGPSKSSSLAVYALEIHAEPIRGFSKYSRIAAVTTLFARRCTAESEERPSCQGDARSEVLRSSTDSVDPNRRQALHSPLSHLLDVRQRVLETEQPFNSGTFFGEPCDGMSSCQKGQAPPQPAPQEAGRQAPSGARCVYRRHRVREEAFATRGC
jgi:hypothetical protein